MKKVLTIAGSDCSGGAGIQADLKTMTAHKVYGMSAVTALTAQNTEGVAGILESSPEFVALQLDSICSDIRPDAVKIGMVSNSEIIKIIADKLTEYRLNNIVLDPVMISTSGKQLMRNDASAALITHLFPLASVITPNIPEAEALSSKSIHTRADMEQAAHIIRSFTSSAVYIKGGHSTDHADDLLFEQDQYSWLSGKRIDNSNTHGTGCTLSSSIACNLAEGYTVYESVKNAKEYVRTLLHDTLDLGGGSGPLNHCCTI